MGLEIRGRVGQEVLLEIRDVRARLLAMQRLKLHPLMPGTWQPELGAELLTFTREA